MSRYTLHILLSDDLDSDIADYYKNYKSQHDDDSGFDLPAMSDYCISTKQQQLECGFIKSTPIKFGISCCMVDNQTNKTVGYYLYPRSSFHKYNLIVANHIGIIDAGYRGSITGMVKPLHLTEKEEMFSIKKGTKLFQLCAPDLSHFDIKIVNSLPESSRGNKGFGSTGK